MNYTLQKPTSENDLYEKITKQQNDQRNDLWKKIETKKFRMEYENDENSITMYSLVDRHK